MDWICHCFAREFFHINQALEYDGSSEIIICISWNGGWKRARNDDNDDIQGYGKACLVVEHRRWKKMGKKESANAASQLACQLMISEDGI